MKAKLLGGLTVVMLGMGVTPSLADTDTWTGCRMGLAGGMAAINNTANFNNYLTVDGFGASGGSFGLLAGCDVKFGQMVAGAFVNYDWFTGTSTSVSFPGYELAELSYEDKWGIGGRLGFLMTPNTMVYALAAYSRMDTGDLNLFGGAVNIDVPSFTGVSVGGGLETQIAKDITLGLEYQYTDYGSKSIEYCYTNLDLSPEVQTVRATLSWKFTNLFKTEEAAYSPPLK